jgi:hypothetical protein
VLVEESKHHAIRTLTILTPARHKPKIDPAREQTPPFDGVEWSNEPLFSISASCRVMSDFNTLFPNFLNQCTALNQALTREREVQEILRKKQV